MRTDQNIFFLMGDTGFNLVEPIFEEFPDRTLNGLKNVDGQVVAGLAGGHGNSYYNASDSKVHDPYVESGSLFGISAETINSIAPIAIAFVPCVPAPAFTPIAIAVCN